MYIYWEEYGQSYLQHIPSNVAWTFSCEYDEVYGLEHLNLKIGDQIYCIDEAGSWIESYPNIKVYIGDYFSAVVKSVFDLMVKEKPEFINLSDIKEEVFELYWKGWKEKGLVTD